MMRNFLYILSICLFVISQNTNAQQIKVTGTVTEGDSKSPLIAVQIIVKGSLLGTTTDLNGNYSITVPDSNAVLVFKYVGYKTYEIPVKNKTQLNLRMELDTKLLNETLVTAIAIKREKKELGYAAQEVKANEITNSGENNLVTSMNAKVAGVQVTSSSGVPGAAARIRIRGNTSITGSNSPLMVVDGIPIDNSGGGSSASLDGANRAIDINPNDVETMTILKGAAATALYGIRAANGAIIITTKKGADNKTKITYSASVGFDRVNKLPEIQTLYSGGNNGTFSSFANRQNSAGDSRSWGAPYTSLRYNGIATALDQRGDIIESDDQNLLPVSAYNNPEAFFQTGISNNHYLSFQGGNANNKFFVSAGRTQQGGVVPNTSFNRTSFKLSGESIANKKLTLSGSANYMQTNTTRLRRGANWSAPMVSLFRSPSDYDITGGFEDPLNTPEAYTFPDGTQKKNAVFDNPFFSVNNNPNTEMVNRLIGYLGANYKINDFINFTGRVGTDLFFVDSKEVYHKFSSENHNQESYKGSYFEMKELQRDFNSDFILSGNKKVKENWELGFVLGHNYWITTRNNIGLQALNFIIEDFNDFSNTDQETFQPFWGDRQQALAAVYGEAKIAYKNFLYVSITGRNEWASTLPKDRNSFFYPSVSTSFVFSELINQNNALKLGFGKLRLSYAQVGNIPSPYLTNTYFTPTVTGGFNGQNPFRSQLTQGNPTLLPEIATQFEVGTELRFFNNKLLVDAAVYNTLNQNQIIVAQVPASTGFSSALVNGGSIRNTGVELLIEGTVIEKKVIWRTGVNFTRQRSVVEDIVRDFQRVGGVAGFTQGFSGAVEGYQYGVILGASRYKRLGQDPNDLTIRNDLPIIVNEQGYPEIETPSNNGFYIVGNPNPDFIVGWRNTFEYKQFTFGFLFDLRRGGDVFNLTKLNMLAVGTHLETENRDVLTVFPNSVNADGSENTKEILMNRDFYNYLGGDFGNVPERGIEDASWVRLREVTLNYRFNGRWIEERTRVIKGIDIGISGRNLLLFTKYSGIDPETNAAGNDASLGRDAFNMPNTKGILFNLNVTF